MSELTNIQQEKVTEVPIEFTDAAAVKVAALIAEENNLNLKLRVFITGGGCSGFQYGFTFDEQQNSDDIVVLKTVQPDASADTKPVDVVLLIDAMSFQYLMGAEIDYKQDLSGARFVIRNPNAKTTCGCGSSFGL